VIVTQEQGRVKESVANTTFEVAKQGGRDPQRLRDLAVKTFTE
jgi:hypothetical protein